MKKLLKDLLDKKQIDLAVSAIYFAIRIIRHKKNMLLENIQAESSIEEKQLGTEIVSEVLRHSQKLMSDFTERDIDKYIVDLSDYIEERNRSVSIDKQDLLKTWRNESVHKYEDRIYERKFKPTVFISYQYDQGVSNVIKHFLLDLKIELIVRESYSSSDKILSSFIEAGSLTDLAIFILPENTNRFSSSQLFELGYWLGKLGRENVILFAEEFSSIPMDLAGLKLLNPRSDDWKYELAVQMDLAGIQFEKEKWFK